MNEIEKLHEIPQNSMSRDDLAQYLDRLANSVEEDPGQWENLTLPNFLRAWAAWLPDMDQAYINTGSPVPESLTWQLIAQMVLVGATYE